MIHNSINNQIYEICGKTTTKYLITNICVNLIILLFLVFSYDKSIYINLYFYSSEQCNIDTPNVRNQTTNKHKSPQKNLPDKHIKNPRITWQYIY